MNSRSLSTSFDFRILSQSKRDPKAAQQYNSHHYASTIFHVLFLQVRKILDLVQSKGEEVSEYFIRVLQKVTDAYYELQPWLDEIAYEPSENICSRPVVNTDPGKAMCPCPFR